MSSKSNSNPPADIIEYLDLSLIPPLIDASQDTDKEVRASAVKALARVARTLTGPEGELQTEEAEIDRFFELVSRALKQTLGDEDKYVRVEAAEGLRELYCADQEVFDVFVAAASDEDESLRSRAAVAFWLGVSDSRAPLWQVKTDAGLAVLLSLLQDNSERVRNHALRTIRSITLTEKVDAPGLTEVLTKFLQDADREVRDNAAFVLAGIGSESEAALPVLIEALGDNDVLKRKAAAFALRKMGTAAAPAIPDMINGLTDAEVRVRTGCAEALGQFGAATDDVVIHALLEAELQAEQNSDRETSLTVKRALTTIGKEQVEAAQSRAAARKARDFFPLFGFKPEEIPFWMLMLFDADANQRARAIMALGYLGAAEAIPELRRLLNDEDEDVRQRAAAVLDRLDEQA